MRRILLLTFIFLSLISSSQIPKSGTYIYKYCDIEYNKCLGVCKVVIRKNHITVYATVELAKQLNCYAGEILNKGIIIKNKSGEWIIKPSKDEEDSHTKIDFKKKQYWQF